MWGMRERRTKDDFKISVLHNWENRAPFAETETTEGGRQEAREKSAAPFGNVKSETDIQVENIEQAVST